MTGINIINKYLFKPNISRFISIFYHILSYFFNEKVPEGLGQSNDGMDYDIEVEYVIPYYNLSSSPDY